LANQRLLDTLFDMSYRGPAQPLGPLVRPSAASLRFNTLPPPDFLKWISLVLIAQVGLIATSGLAIVIATVCRFIYCLIVVSFADQQYHGGCIKHNSELEAERIRVLDVVSCDQVTAERVEEEKVSKLGRRPERDHR
jgi:hypothetical protein